MKTIVMVLLISFFMASCNDLLIFDKEQAPVSCFKNIRQHHLSDPDSLVILTYNIQLGFAKGENPWDKNIIGGTPEHLDSIVSAIKSLNPDIVSLQEVGRGRSNQLIAEQVEYLAERLDMNYAYGDDGMMGTGDWLSEGAWGNAILTRFEIQAVENPELYHGHNRSLTTSIKVSDSLNVSVLNVHYKAGSSHDEFQIQHKHLLAVAEEQASPVILTGDYNFYNFQNLNYITSSGYIFSLDSLNLQERLHVMQRGTIRPYHVIDHIYLESPYFEVLGGYLLDKQYDVVSDHIGYYISVRYLKGK